MRSAEVDSNEQNDIIFIIVIIIIIIIITINIIIIIIIAIIIFVTACASQIFTIAFGPLLCVLLRSLPFPICVVTIYNVKSPYALRHRSRMYSL